MHRHDVDTQKTIPYDGNDHSNPTSGGSHTVVETCSCSAERRTSVNGAHRGHGRWHLDRPIHVVVCDHTSGHFTAVRIASVVDHRHVEMLDGDVKHWSKGYGADTTPGAARTTSEIKALLDAGHSLRIRT